MNTTHRIDNQVIIVDGWIAEKFKVNIDNVKKVLERKILERDNGMNDDF